IRGRSSVPAIAGWPAAAAKAATQAARACRPSTSSWRWKASFFVRLSGQKGARMRVLITRPEREATALATALSQRGHVAVIAPLFRLDILHPPGDFAGALAACQAV